MGGRWLAAMLAGIAAATALATGCGGGGGGDEGASRPRPTPRWAPAELGLDPPRYVKRATALCLRHRQRIAADLEAFVERRQGEDEIARAGMEEVVLPGFRAQYEELRRLPFPPGKEDFLTLMLSKFEASLKHGEEDLGRLFRVKLSGYSEFAEGSLMTREYRIEGCGSLGRSPEAVFASLRLYALFRWT